MRQWLGLPRPVAGDLIAGLSVALVIIPQSLAYAQLAGMPVVTGLFASALPLIVRAPLGSSPYLQTGPVAMTSLLTLAALHGAGYATDDPDYVKLGALLALIVGLFRLLLGLFRLGWIVYLICEPVMLGFTSGAAIIIIASQAPKVVGTTELIPDGSVMEQGFWSLIHVLDWSPVAIGVSVITLVLMIGGRRVHRLFPGVAVAVVVGIVFSRLVDEPGAIVGEPVGVPEGFPSFGLELPWAQLPSLVLGGFIIALVGFAEPASIARVFARAEGSRWDASKELVSAGFANLASALSGAFPVGGSFSRSSVNRVAGAKTVWSGGITGLVVLCFLPFASVLDPLPLAVLGAIVVGAVANLFKPRDMIGQWRHSWINGALSSLTFVATLALAPNIQWAILIGIAATGVAHFTSPLRFDVTDGATADDPVLVEPKGLVWLGSAKTFDRELRSTAAQYPERDVVIDFNGDTAIDPAVEESIAKLAGERNDIAVTIAGFIPAPQAGAVGK